MGLTIVQRIHQNLCTKWYFPYHCFVHFAYHYFVQLQAEQEGTIKRQVRQLEKDRREAAMVLADALKVQKRVSWVQFSAEL